MKKFGLFLAVLSLVISPAMGVVQELPDGGTYQCWTFTEQTGPFGIVADVDQNPFGTPAALINDLSVSGSGVYWTNNIGDGAWVGEEFKIILDIPNQQIANPYKTLTVTMQFQGDLEFAWVADIVSGERFTEVTDPVIRDGELWRTYTQTFEFRPNPREEIVVIGVKGVTAAAAIDQICISTICIPEPMTLALLAVGGFFALRTKRS